MTDERTAVAGAPSVENGNGGTDVAKPDGPRFSHKTIKRIEGLGIDPAALVQRYTERTRRLRVRDPDAYLIGMATEEAAKRFGMTPNQVMALSSTDMKERAQALVEVTAGDMKNRKASKELAGLVKTQRGRLQ